VLTAASLFLGLAALFAFTRSHWLDDWDSVNFAFGLDDFDVTKHWPHPPGFPVYIAAGKLVYRVIADHAAALTLVSALSGGAVASMFYVLERRHSDWPIALCATLIMALSPLFWLQSGLALTDMFGMLFVVAFLLVEGTTATTPRGALARRVACGLIAGLSLGARPHITLLIVLYWCFRASSHIDERHVLTAVLAFAVGIAAWLIPACFATGGAQIYWTATVGQFEWRFGGPGVSVLGTPITGQYLFARALALIGSLGQAFAPMHLTTSHIARRAALGLLIVVPYVVFAWRGASRSIARPYLIASAVYLLMLFILLPVRHLRYFLPFSLVVGWSVSGYLALFHRPVVRALALAALAAVTVLPSFFLVGGLGKVPPPVAGLAWVKANRPAAILYSDSLRRHADFYWPEGETVSEPRAEADCDQFRKSLASGRPVLSTNSKLCGIDGTKLVEFTRDARVHDKHHIIPIFEYGKSAGHPG
jgi:4-amino-4-deoxy-L-arabinose transferase-like glycosyltransferase